MPVKLRLRRQGRKNAAHYAIVVADSRSPRDGRFIEKVGFYNPLTVPAQIYVDESTVIKWMQNGAQPTHTVRALLRHAGVTLRHALVKQGKSDEEIERIVGLWQTERDKKAKKVLKVDINGKPMEVVPASARKKQSAEAAE
ncbi:MAG: 30S ribosomal protein S16 [Bacteroidia bacterium]|nr:30S ribosomal protein S16 [Bacteroidia bacterium]